MLQRDFDLSVNNPEHQLSLTMTIDQLSYAIFDNHGVLIRHKTYPNISFNAPATLEILKADPDLTKGYGKISVTALTGDAHQLSFRDDQISDIIPNFEFKNVQIEKLPGAMVYNYYGLTPAQKNLLGLLFQQDTYEIHNFVFALTSYFIGLNQPIVHLHLEENSVYIYIQKNGTIQFFNSYWFKTANDILYFTLAACKLNGINMQDDKKTISGGIEKDSEIYVALSRYLGNLDIIEDASFRLDPTSGYKPHYYFAHYIGKSCVL